MDPTGDGSDGSSAPAPAGPAFVTASHRVLFEESGELVCDACQAPVQQDDDAGGDGCAYRVSGEGVYMWSRGDEARFEKAPLCPDCAAAIGMSALARWEIEEEEG